MSRYPNTDGMRSSARYRDARDMLGPQRGTKAGHSGPVDRAYPQAIKGSASRQNRRHDAGRKPVHRIRRLPLDKVPSARSLDRATPGTQLNPGGLNDRLQRRFSGYLRLGTNGCDGPRLEGGSRQHEQHYAQICNGWLPGSACDRTGRRRLPRIWMHSPPPASLAMRSQQELQLSPRAARSKNPRVFAQFK